MELTLIVLLAIIGGVTVLMLAAKAAAKCWSSFTAGLVRRMDTRARSELALLHARETDLRTEINLLRQSNVELHLENVQLKERLRTQPYRSKSTN